MSTSTKTHININVLYAIYSGKKKTAIGVGNEFSLEGLALHDLKLEYYFMRHHERSLCRLVYCGPPTKKILRILLYGLQLCS